MITINSNGNIGIGTYPPSTKLEINPSREYQIKILREERKKKIEKLNKL